MHFRPSVHPSAEEFLRQLILFIDSRGSELLSSKAAFKLQPRALEYVALRLEGLCQLQHVKTSNPIRFLAGAVADLTDFLRMEKVQQFCARVKHLKLYSSAQDIRDPTPVNFSPFKSLMVLEVRGCDLSLICPRGVECIRSTVEILVVQDSLECLWHLLEPNKLDEAESSASHRWTKLKQFSVIYNDMKNIDASLRLIPNVTVMDFSRNRIHKAKHLSDLTHLTALDLSFNRLKELGEVTMSVGLQKLFLQSNGIRSLEGIDNLERLEELDLRWNVISSLSEVVRLKTLSSLKLVSLDGNPISVSQTYRLHVLACLLEWRDDITLDGKTTSDLEKKKAKRLTVTREGVVEILPSESPITAPSPSSLWEFVSPFLWPFRRRLDTSIPSSESIRPLISDDDVLPNLPPRPIKRIVDIPEDICEPVVDVHAVETRNVTRKSLVRVHTKSVDMRGYHGSFDESRFGALGFV